MENETTQEQEEVVVQEENATTEEETQEETVTIPKKDFTKLKRKAIAYDADKNEPKEVPRETSSQPSELSIDTLFAIKDLDRDEMEALKEEAKDLGIPFDKYLSSNSGKTFLKSVRQERKSKDASQALNSKSPVYQKFTQDDLKKMSASELEKILPRD